MSIVRWLTLIVLLSIGACKLHAQHLPPAIELNRDPVQLVHLDERLPESQLRGAGPTRVTLAATLGSGLGFVAGALLGAVVIVPADHAKLLLALPVAGIGSVLGSAAGARAAAPGIPFSRALRGAAIGVLPSLLAGTVILFSSGSGTAGLAVFSVSQGLFTSNLSASALAE